MLHRKQTLRGLDWDSQFCYIQEKKSRSLANRRTRVHVCVLLSESSHSFSFPSRKLWIFWTFSSCWPRASSKMPIGDLFSPAPSILFSSLFFMLRRRSEACANITEKQMGKWLLMFEMFGKNKPINFCSRQTIITSVFENLRDFIPKHVSLILKELCWLKLIS